MKISMFFMTFLMAVALTQAQVDQTDTSVGDVLVLGEPASFDYQHVDFPRRNIIIKRGAIPNFNNLIGEKVLVEEVEKKPDGSTSITVRRKDGQNFFRFFPTVEVNLEEALARGEVKRT